MRIGLTQKTQLTIADTAIVITAASAFLWFCLYEIGTGLYELARVL